jgi:hypothetical protein
MSQSSKAISTVLLALAFACVTPAIALANIQDSPKDAAAKIEAADAQVERIASDTSKYLDELDAAIDLAKKGTYGKLAKGAGNKLDESRALIGTLLAGDRDPRSLQDDQRLALFNAHQTIASIINKDDKSRIVCKREQHLGSRLATTECLTVGEREALATHSARETADLQRVTCSPENGNACSK